MRSKRNVTVRKRKDGLFEIRYSSNGKQYSVYGSTVKICRDKYGIILEDRKNKPRVKSMLFVTWYDKYVNLYKKGFVSDSTLKNMNGIFQKYILPCIGKMTLKQIHSDDIQKIVNNMLIFPRQQNIAFIYLRACLEQARKNMLIEHNPCDAVIIKKNITNKGKALTKQEENKLINYLNETNPPIKNLVYLYLTTGMRRSELLNVKFKDLDFDKNEIVVNGTKTANSKRIVQVNKNVMNLFPKCEQPFADWNCDKVNREFKKICDILNFKNVGIHTLRHTFATRCIECGVDMVVVQKWLGHSTIRLTADINNRHKSKEKLENWSKIKVRFA